MFVFFIVLYYLWAVALSVTCVTQLLFNYGHPESQLQLNYISVSCITIIITPKLTSEQQEGSLSDCVSSFPMKMSASPPVLIILEVAISRRLEATNQAKWQFRVGHGAHGGRGRWEHGAGQGSQWQPIIDRFPKRILNPTLSALLFVTGWRGCNGKSFSWGSKYFSRYSVTSIWCTAIYIFAKNLKPPCNLPISSPST